MTDSFWTGGPDAYAKGLREQYEPLLANLRKRFDSADETDRAKLESEIARTEAEYKSQLNAIDDALF